MLNSGNWQGMYQVVKVGWYHESSLNPPVLTDKDPFLGPFAASCRLSNMEQHRHTCCRKQEKWFRSLAAEGYVRFRKPEEAYLNGVIDQRRRETSSTALEKRYGWRRRLNTGFGAVFNACSGCGGRRLCCGGAWVTHRWHHWPGQADNGGGPMVSVGFIVRSKKIFGRVWADELHNKKGRLCAVGAEA